MRWQGRRQSSNIEDHRGAGMGGFGRGRIPIGLPGGFGRPGGGLGRAGGGGLGLLVIGLVVLWILGANPLDLLTGGSTGSPGVATQQTTARPAGNDQGRQFVATVLADTEDTWTAIFRSEGLTYRPPTLVLFTGGTRSGCGTATSAAGPFYCPADRKVYLDLGFFDQLRRQFGASGDFAQAYVIAHEIGHHVQNELGVLGELGALRRQAGQSESSRMSVRIELQADCLAGVWAHHTRHSGWLEAGDIEEALNAAAAVGDDMIQRRTQGHVVPDAFNHGSSEQRVSWFRRGLDRGEVAACDTSRGV